MDDDRDHEAFSKTFLHLLRLPLKRRPTTKQAQELRELELSYFKLLRRHALSTVLAAAEVLVSTSDTFPTPADWLKAIARTAPPADRRCLSERESDEYLRAKRLRWRDVPCRCDLCLHAGVSDRQLRYVPDERDDGDVERAVDAHGDDVIPGHWAHGAELAEWYASHDRVVALSRQHFRCVMEGTA